jgi:hypothetical protein
VTGDREALRREAIETAALLGVTPTEEQVSAYVERISEARASRKAPVPRDSFTRPAWLSWVPETLADGSPWGRRYFTHDGYEAAPICGRRGTARRPSRWLVTGPGIWAAGSETTTVRGIVETIEYARKQA